MSAWKEFTTGAVVIDDRYLPTIVTTFYGEVTLEAATWHGTTHQAVVEAQSRRKVRIVTITGSSHTRAPSAEVRRYWAQLTKNFPPHIKDATLAAFVVIKNPVLRGIMTALVWLNPELRTVEVYESVEVALRTARQRLEAANQAAPPDVETYAIPGESESVVARWQR
jgi:hypothetical protein